MPWCHGRMSLSRCITPGVRPSLRHQCRGRAGVPHKPILRSHTLGLAVRCIGQDSSSHISISPTHPRTAIEVLPCHRISRSHMCPMASEATISRRDQCRHTHLPLSLRPTTLAGLRVSRCLSTIHHCRRSRPSHLQASLGPVGEIQPSRTLSASAGMSRYRLRAQPREHWACRQLASRPDRRMSTTWAARANSRWLESPHLQRGHAHPAVTLTWVTCRRAEAMTPGRDQALANSYGCVVVLVCPREREYLATSSSSEHLRRALLSLQGLLVYNDMTERTRL